MLLRIHCVTQRRRNAVCSTLWKVYHPVFFRITCIINRINNGILKIFSLRDWERSPLSKSSIEWVIPQKGQWIPRHCSNKQKCGIREKLALRITTSIKRSPQIPFFLKRIEKRFFKIGLCIHGDYKDQKSEGEEANTKSPWQPIRGKVVCDNGFSFIVKNANFCLLNVKSVRVFELDPPVMGRNGEP